MVPQQLYTDEIIAHLKGINGNIPLHRKESKQVYSFSKLPFYEQLAVWNQVWQTDLSFYPRLHATFFFGAAYEK